MTSLYRFLFDECLTADLVALANNHGYAATHVKHLNRLGSSDRSLSVVAFETDSVLVTNNASDFKRIYLELDLHPGLVIILPSVSRSRQPEFMSVVLQKIATMRDCVNLIIEIDAAFDLTISDWSR